MNTIIIVFNQIIIMFSLVGVGFYLKKTNIFTETTVKELNDFLLKIVVGASIITSFNMEYDKEIAISLIVSLGIAFAIHIVFIILSKFIYKGSNHASNISRISTTYSNCSFMAIPLVYSIFGNEGVIYATAYLAVYNITLWTHGVMLVDEKLDKSILKMAGRIFKQPIIIATIIGFLLFVFNISLPWQVSSSISYIGALNTPIAMMLIGIFIANTNLIEGIKDKQVIKVCFMRLILMPLVVIALLYIVKNVFGLREIIAITLVISASCPVGSIASMLCKRYDLDGTLAVRAVTFSTLISIITIPMMMFIANLLL